MPFRLAAPFRGEKFRDLLRPSRLALLVVAIAAIAPYLISLAYDAVWEDVVLTSDGGVGGTSLLDCFTKPFTLYWYRPIVAASFWLDRTLWGTELFTYHRTNIVLHAITAVAVVGLFEAVFRSSRTALLGGLLYALHPVHVISVAWIGGRTDSLCALWTVLFAWGLVCGVRSTGRKRAGCLALSTAAFLLAVLCKELVHPGILLVPLAFRCWGAERGPHMRRAALGAILPFCGASLLAIGLCHRFGSYAMHGGIGSAGSTLAAVLRTACYYGLLLFVPSVRWVHTFSLGAFVRAGGWSYFAGVVLLVAVVKAFLALLRRGPEAAWFLALVVVTLAMVANIMPVGFMPIAPYRAAPASIGAAALVAWLLDRWLQAAQSAPGRLQRLAPRFACVGMVVWWGAVTVADVPRYEDEAQVDRACVQSDPDSFWAVTGCYRKLMIERRMPEARRMLDRTLARIFGSDAWQRSETAARALVADPGILERLRAGNGNAGVPREIVAGYFKELAHVQPDPTGSEAAEYNRAALGISPGDTEARVALAACTLAAQRRAEAAPTGGKPAPRGDAPKD